MLSKPDFTATRIAGNRYFARWNEMRAQGVKPFILSRSAQPNEWQAWKSFYRARGLWALVDMMEDGRSDKCVPCLDPADFEPIMFVDDRRVKDD